MCLNHKSDHIGHLDFVPYTAAAVRLPVLLEHYHRRYLLQEVLSMVRMGKVEAGCSVDV